MPSSMFLSFGRRIMSKSFDFSHTSKGNRGTYKLHHGGFLLAPHSMTSVS